MPSNPSAINAPISGQSIMAPSASSGNLIQVGSTQMTPEMFAERTTEIKGDYATALGDVNERFNELAANIAEIQNGISQQITQTQAVASASYNELVSSLNKQVANIQHAQNMQVGTAASQLDAMLSTGQFGGNVYRAQQVYSMNLTSVIASSMQTIANVTLQYRGAAEQLRVQASQQTLASYIQGASVVLGAVVDLAKTYAMVRADLTINRNNQMNQVFQFRVQQDISNRDRDAQVNVEKMRIEANKLMAQWQIDASMNETILNISLQDRRIEAEKLISDRNNQVKIQLTNMEMDFQREQSKLGRELQTYLTKMDIDTRKYIAIRQQDMERELGLLQIESVREARREQMEHELKIESARLGQQYDLAAMQADLQMSQFNQQMALSKEQYKDSLAAQAKDERIMGDFMATLDAESAAYSAQNKAIMDRMASYFVNQSGVEVKPASRGGGEKAQTNGFVYSLNGKQQSLTFDSKAGKYSQPKE
jgi:hypothetical protein